MLYLKQINVIAVGPLGAEDPGQLPPLPPLNPALIGMNTINQSVLKNLSVRSQME